MGVIKLIVGLGNPGAEYTATRHNAGWWWLSAFCTKNNYSIQNTAKYKASYTKVNHNNQSIHIIAPNTYMNLSGDSVAIVKNFFQIKPQEILVVHDELDLEPGDIRFKQGGGHGGHNGLRSIIDRIGSRDFFRLRIGIGHPGKANGVESYVLKKPTTDERISIDNSIDDSLFQIDQFLSGDTQEAIKQLHTKK